MRQIKHILSLIGIVMVLATPLRSQNYSIFLPSGNITPQVTNSAINVSPPIAGNRFLILQFYDLPNNLQKIQLSVLGVQLYDYIPNYAFLAKVPANTDLSLLPIRAAVELTPADKMSLQLQEGNYESCAYKQGVIFLQITPMPGISPDFLKNSLQADMAITAKVKGNVLSLGIDENRLEELAQHPGIKAVETIPCELVKDGIRGRTLGRMNGGNGYTTTSYTGNGVGISIGDDGGVNHIDFKGRLFDHTQSLGGNHGDMTCGLAIGAGNLNPYGLGMATRSYLHLYDIEGLPHIVNAIQAYLQDGVVITSTSFSEGCSAVYNLASSEIDLQVSTQPQILHFFSAGNSSGNPCNPIYGQVANPFGIHFGNITGGRKCAKNVMAVGNVRYNDSLFVLSSRGPASDGRIKPDICAHGQGNLSTDDDNKYRSGGGTSAASPTAAGGAALLYEAYRLLHTGLNPESGLIKALMLNTAEDLGRPGPDFEFGWGRLNIGRAIKTLNDGQYFQNSIEHHYQKYHQIVIPEGIKEARIMVYWTDPAGSPLSSKALVNDIDITMISSTGEQFKPLILSTVANLDSLIKPAYPGRDHINNVEQVVLKDPQAGAYSLKVFGHVITTAQQNYNVVYTFIKDDITITYPNNGEGFVPGEKEVIRWDAYGDEGTFNIEYSLDSMHTWTPIANNIPGAQRYLNWWVPYTVSGNSFIRVSRNDQFDTSDEKFNIIGQPYFDIDKTSDNSAQISWAPVEGADSYDIFVLTERFMEKIGETDNLFFSFHAQIGDEKWISVRAKNRFGTIGRRANAKKYVHRACNSTFRLDFTFDLYPGEIQWTVSKDGEEYLSGGPYVGVPPNSYLSEVKCLQAGCYTLAITDSYGDGICCDRGNGHFELYGSNGQLITSGGDFAGNKILFFCIEETTPQLFSGGISGVEQPSCANGNDGSASVFAVGGSGNYTYQWSNGFTGTHATNLAAGVYSVTISDGSSSIISNITLQAPAPVQIQLSNNPAPCGSTQGGVIFSTITGGSPPYNYQWEDNSQLAFLTQAQEGWHNLTVTDDKGCTANAQIYIAPLSALEVGLQASQVSCNGATDGGILSQITGGVPPYSFIWSNGATTSSILGLPAGNYQVTVQDNNGCTGTSNINVIEPAPISASLLTTDPSCFNESNGNIQVFSNGGTGTHQYIWNNGVNFSILNPIGAGTYYVTITDEQGCSLVKSATLNNPTEIQLDLNVFQPTIDEGGSIDLSVAGGKPPYQYHWSNNATNQDLYGLTGGQYSVTVTDSNGCQKSTSRILQNAPTDVYCLLRGSNTQHEWIQSVTFNNIENISGPDNGLGNYVGVVFQAAKGFSHNITLSPGFANYEFDENWRVWIDYNQDHDFDDPGELVLQEAFNNAVIESNIEIPNSASTGLTRMRIAMKYGAMATTCETFPYGEVEEYTINISSVQGLNRDTDKITIDHLQGKTFEAVKANFPYPNPTSETINLDFVSKRKETGSINIYNINYQRVAKEAVMLQKGTNVLSIPVSHLPAGVYQIEIEDGQGKRERQTFVIQPSQ